LLEQRLIHTLQHKGLCKLLGLNYEVQYKKGVENHGADALSMGRGGHELNNQLDAIIEIVPSWLEDLKASYIEDAWATETLLQVAKGEPLGKGVVVHTGLIRKDSRIFMGTHSQWRTQVIQPLHDSSVGGHSGIFGTYQRVRKYFYWSKLKETVLQHVQFCEVCQLNKREHSQRWITITHTNTKQCLGINNHGFCH
jgi:Integrase zinc binding domain